MHWERGRFIILEIGQRTGKPPARLSLPSGPTWELMEYKLDPYTPDAESGALLQA